MADHITQMYRPVTHERSIMEYTLSFGSTMHSRHIYLGLYSALLEAERHRFLNVPVFIYDAQGMVAAVGRDGAIEIYDARLQQALRQQPRLTHLRVMPHRRG